jgi:predicted Zn-dependent protease
MFCVATLVGCNTGGGGGEGFSVGSLIGGKAGQYTDAGLKAGSALTMGPEMDDEMGRVLNQDGLNAVKNARLTEAGMQALNTTDRRVAEFNQRSNQLVQTALTSGWSQPQETKADSDAVRLMQDAGYDPGGLPRFLGRMQQRGGAGSAKPLGTHPGTADRISRTSAQIGGNRGGATNRERFAKIAAEAKF